MYVYWGVGKLRQNLGGGTALLQLSTPPWRRPVIVVPGTTAPCLNLGFSHTHIYSSIDAEISSQTFVYTYMCLFHLPTLTYTSHTYILHVSMYDYIPAHTRTRPINTLFRLLTYQHVQSHIHEGNVL